MILGFILTMPRVGSWNGKWSGETNLYARTRPVGTSTASVRMGDALIGHHSYAWSDGWRADVEVREVTSGEANRLRRKSCGFSGYDWMIDSLLQHGDIVAPSDREETP